MTIHVIGAGGVGFWLCAGLARAHGSEMVVYDDDTLTGGLGHMRLPAAMPSTFKVDLLRGFLIASMGMNPADVPKIKTLRFEGDEVSGGDWVIDCSDMPLTVRQEIWRKAEERGANMLRVSYDGANSIVVVSSGLPLIGSARGGYQNVPSLALSFMAGGMGAEVVNRLLSENQDRPLKTVEIQVSLAEMMGDEIKTFAKSNYH